MCYSMLIRKWHTNSFAVYIYAWLKHRSVFRINDLCTRRCLSTSYYFIYVVQIILKIRPRNAERARRSRTYVTEKNVTNVRKMIHENRRGTYRQIEDILCSNAPANRSKIINLLHYTKFCFLWVSRILTENQKKQRTEEHWKCLIRDNYVIRTTL